jgi:alkanesulfonate monooxygenase SsuD/methylene tetrahydromethanopterin reductase-like flavin-dependent oxidoreductase (luciferase family)
VILGVGVGSLQQEFELLGASFDDRGTRGDDAMRALRASLSKPEPEYHGTHYDYSEFLVEPCAVQARVPLWVGGRTYRSLRRAVELGDGWAPFGLRTDEIAQMVARAGESDAWAARDSAIDVILQNEHPLDPVGDAERVSDQLGRFAAAGATGVNVRFVHHSPTHYREQLAALAALA